MAASRLELALLELEQEWLRLSRLALHAVAGAVLCLLAMGLGLAAWVLSRPEPERVGWLTGLALVCAAAACATGWEIRRLGRRRRRWLSLGWLPPPRRPGG